jgi:hypothetical protein
MIGPWKIEPRYWPELPGKTPPVPEPVKKDLNTEKQPSKILQDQPLTKGKKHNPPSPYSKFLKPRSGACSARKRHIENL